MENIEEQGHSARHKTNESLKVKLLKEWDNLSMDIVRIAIDSEESIESRCERAMRPIRIIFFLSYIINRSKFLFIYVF